MIIVYNPKDGAPIKDFISRGVRLTPHYPDGYEMPNEKVSNGLLQYEDPDGEILLETYQFLTKLTAEEAQKIIERPEDPKYKCDFPGCDFSTHTPIALKGHSRKHDKSLAEAQKPLVDTELIPVADGEKVQSRIASAQPQSAEERATQNGLDSDGVEWYGEGVQVNNPNPAFGAIRPAGKGHFVG
jgi:hypothetical protein